jgi:hypothetical protein
MPITGPRTCWCRGRATLFATLLWLSIAAVLVAASGVSLRAQAQAPTKPRFVIPVAVGDTVQVDAPPRIPTLSRARVIELRPASMVLRVASVATDAVIPMGDVKWLAVRRGSRGHTVAGAFVGLAAGAVISGAIYSIRNQKKGNLGSTISEYAVIGAASGAVAGGVAGSTIRGDHWVPLIRGFDVEQIGLGESPGRSRLQ